MTQSNSDHVADEEEILQIYTNMNSRYIKVAHFFDLIEIIEKNNLWPEIRNRIGGKELDVPVRIVIDTLLLNAVKLALYEHCVRQSSADQHQKKAVETSGRFMLSATARKNLSPVLVNMFSCGGDGGVIDRADRADRQRERDRQIEERRAEARRADIERAQREERERVSRGLPPH